MSNLIFVKCTKIGNQVVPELGINEVADLVSSKKIVILKQFFPEEMLLELRETVIKWGKEAALVSQDDFRSNYHSLRAKVSNIQKTPHVFHDYNFNDFTKLPELLNKKLFEVFDTLRIFYNTMTSYQAKLGVIEGEPFFHPQIIHYPLGGGFFGRHNHNLLPQKIGLILSMSKYGIDYPSGGTCFVINDEIIDIEGHHDIGDLCLWPNDVDHWVKQSPLNDKFDWDSDKGRWVATLAYFNPF